MSKSIKAANIKLKRAYERPAADDGVRILIDRLWPRGVSKADAAIDHPIILSSSPGCAHWQSKARSRSCSLPMTNVTTTPSC
jgi:uncharacterized protein YeaO (DUF488 family)